MLWVKTSRFLYSSSFRFALLSLVIIWLALMFVLLGMFQFNRSNMMRVLEWQMNTDEETVLAALKNNPTENIEPLLLSVDIQPNMQISLDGKLLRSRPTTGFQMDQYRGSRNAREDSHHDLEISRTVTFNDHKITLKHRVGWFDDLYDDMIEIIIRALAATLLLAVLISAFLAQRSVRRLQKINKACQTIIDGHLDYRIPLSNKGTLDDYDQLSQSMNVMLDRIQQLMLQVSQVTDNIAHDLRSPLARLRFRLENIQSRNNDEELNGAIQDADRLLTMFNGLLRISKIEARELDTNKEVDMRQLLVDVCDMYRPVADARHIQLNADVNEGRILGDANLLFQALSNVLDNAVKFSPENSWISVSSKWSQDRYDIEIHDAGPGIPEESMKEVFERFVRLDESRSLPGFGLGLSQVKAIVDLHRGNIVLANNSGLSVNISLPITAV